MSLDAKPSIPSGATLPDVLQQDEDKSTPIVVNSVAEFIENVVKVNKADGTETFYRGHADKDWVLLPSIFRTPNGIANEHLLFRDMVAHEPQSFLECESALDYLVQMQHYGLPTRLLDVTTNPLVALYFACEEVGDTTAIGAILAGLDAGFDVGWYTDCNLETDTTDGIWAGAIAGIIAGSLAIVESEPLAEGMLQYVVDVIRTKYPRANDVVRSGAEAGARAAIEAQSKDGVVFLFSIPKNKVKHYDSDVVSALTNLAKCNTSDHCFKRSSVEAFNEQSDIKFLLRQVKEEKPYFEPLFQACDLGDIFLVKPKYSNSRITNQAGAFFLFGLGLAQDDESFWQPIRLTKSVHLEIPSDWMKVRVIVPKDKKKKILEELANLGITESYIYPGMEQYAKELKKRYNL